LTVPVTVNSRLSPDASVLMSQITVSVAASIMQPSGTPVISSGTSLAGLPRGRA
jgi:hypothetical protein